MKRTAVINVVGLTDALIGDHTPAIRDFAAKGCQLSIEPAFPAVTCTAQSNYLTGVKPNYHGIVGNGWYDRDYSEVHFWKQSNHLVSAPKLWDELKQCDSSFTCAKLFWWYNMYSTIDYSITPRPMYPADGRKVFDIYSSPLSLGSEIKKDIGDFPFSSFWGPNAGIKSSEWIAASAKWVDDRHAPTLSLVYLPHLDYNLQRLGPDAPEIAKDLLAIDGVVSDLIDYYTNRSVRVCLLSEYGITTVNHPVHLNRLFREKGWIRIKDELGLEHLDCGASKAFAVADHQVAHIYINDQSILNDVRKLLEGTEGIENVLNSSDKKCLGIDHLRSGDLIASADKNSWFTYYYWLDDKIAPDFARCVDIHRKMGFDPVELFVNPRLSIPELKILKFLLKKSLGFRALLDIIPLDASLVKGSHGRIPSDQNDYPVLILPKQCNIHENKDTLKSTDVFGVLKQMVYGTIS